MANLLDGDTEDVIKSNHRALCDEGMSESQAMHLVLKKAKKGKTMERALKGVTAKRKDRVEVK